MIKLEARLKGDTAVKALLHKKASAVYKRLSSEVENYLYNVQATAQNIVKSEAFDSGNLHDSIEVHFTDTKKGGGPHGTVGPDLRKAHYAEYVEAGHFAKNGTTWVPGVWYMTRAINYDKSRHSSRIIAGVIDAWRNYNAGGAHNRPIGIANQLSQFDNKGLSVAKIHKTRVKLSKNTRIKGRKYRKVKMF